MDAHQSAHSGAAAAPGQPATRPAPAQDEHFAQHIRRYLLVFYALLFGTVITVGASYIQFGNRSVNIAVALFIALGKASLVAGYFMHLISERKVIYGIMLFTFIFVLGLMVLLLGGSADLPRYSTTH
jgi:caa(3)-type oxidase subunit IV